MADNTRDTTAEAAADHLDALASAIPEGDWKRGGFGDFGPTVYMGDTSVETADNDSGYALADFLEAMSPTFAHQVAALLRAVAHPTPDTDARTLALRLAETVTTRPGSEEEPS
ncbi:hypothetical protein PV516_19585 [Streptomyces scabiei]|uniref:hypothetical protein n=1 Tax=Streptomyces scabiei TaxID=1930 RepID=UPI0029BC8117|nr:hypothetical protein [Streptomyces scabiei]MDX3165993.1 hypothetical protein [Streptomyces scabiei]